MRFLNDTVPIVRGLRAMIARLRQARSVSMVFCAVGVGMLGVPDGTSAPNAEETRQQLAIEGADSLPVAANVLSDQEIQQMVTQLDSVHFESRNAARRELISAGSAAVPFLVNALSEKSRELRFRATEMLSRQFSFDEVAPQLISAMAHQAVPLQMRTILREQAEEQVQRACELPSTGRLFKFWGTDPNSFRRDVLAKFDDARSHQELARTIQPLLGLEEKVNRFSDVMSRLEALSLPYEHQFSAGYVVAHSLAQGMHDNNDDLVQFSKNYIESFEALGGELRLRNRPSHAIRKEISDRANMSQGAADFLVQLIEKDSARRTLLSKRLGVSIESLQIEFFRGLSSPESKQCSRNVGKVHIADMLSEAVSQWEGATDNEALWQIVADARATVSSGDKPKALAYLDALSACRELANHRLGTEEGLGRQLTDRLHQASVQSPDIRSYHPSRSVHDRILALVDLGIDPEHELFPQRFCDLYLEGDNRVTSDSHRLALERYLRTLERIRRVDPQYEQPSIRRFLEVLEKHLIDGHEIVAEGSTMLSQVLKKNSDADGKLDMKALILDIKEWTEPKTAVGQTSE
jgi:hypothetical protein